jgi:hypothetical protein
LLNDDTGRARRRAGPPPAELFQDRLGLTTLLQILARSHLALYEDDREACEQLLEADYVEVSPLLVIPLWRADHLVSSARVCLLASRDASDADADALLTRVEIAVEAIEQLSLECYVDHTRVLRAALAHRRGDRAQAMRLLEAVISDAHMGGDSPLIRACALMRKGELSPDDQGQSLVKDAHTALIEQGIKDPRRFARLFVPEFN